MSLMSLDAARITPPAVSACGRRFFSEGATPMSILEILQALSLALSIVRTLFELWRNYKHMSDA